MKIKRILIALPIVSLAACVSQPAPVAHAPIPPQDDEIAFDAGGGVVREEASDDDFELHTDEDASASQWRKSKLRAPFSEEAKEGNFQSIHAK